MPVPGEELPIPRTGTQETVEALLHYGGFPEPVFAQSPRALRRWQNERLERFFREDVRDLEAVRDLSSLQLLADMVPERVGSPMSLNALREDLEVSHRALTAWMEILDRLYYVFRVRPFASARVRSLRKAAKGYLWDASLVPDRGARFENVIALHLLKLCHFLQDRDGHTAELWYLRDRAGREVDFLVTIGRKPWFAVEADCPRPGCPSRDAPPSGRGRPATAASGRDDPDPLRPASRDVGAFPGSTPGRADATRRPPLGRRRRRALVVAPG